MDPNDTIEKRQMSNEVLAVHVDYLREDVQKVLKGLTGMATKEDVEKIAMRMDKFVTTDRFEALEKKVDTGTIGSTFSRGMKMVQSISVTTAAVVALIGMIAAIVHYFDKIKAVI